MLEDVDNTLREVAKEKGAILVEANDQMKNHPEYFLDDFHLSDNGGRAFAQILLKELRDHDLLPPGASSVPAQTASTD